MKQASVCGDGDQFRWVHAGTSMDRIGCHSYLNQGDRYEPKSSSSLSGGGQAPPETACSEFRGQERRVRPCTSEACKHRSALCPGSDPYQTLPSYRRTMHIIPHYQCQGPFEHASCFDAFRPCPGVVVTHRRPNRDRTPPKRNHENTT